MKRSVPSVCLVARLACGSKLTRNVSIRSTYYDNGVKNPVANVTIGTIFQQRQNLGRTRIRGWQNDVEARVGQVRARRGRLSVQQRQGDGIRPGPRPRCDGGRSHGPVFAAGPEHRGTVNVAALESTPSDGHRRRQLLRPAIRRDQNARIKPGETAPGLPSYGIVDLSASRDIGRNLQVFFGVQNLFESGVPTSSCCRRRSAHRGWSTVASGSAGPADSRYLVRGSWCLVRPWSLVGS